MGRTLLGVFLTLFCAVAAVGQSSTRSPDNGTDWTHLSGGMRVGYIEGFMDGQARACNEGVILLWVSDAISVAEVSMPDKSRDQLAEQLSKNLSDSWNCGLSSFVRKDGVTATYGEIEAAVTKFYEQPENLPVCWRHAVSIEAASMTGNSIPFTSMYSRDRFTDEFPGNASPTAEEYLTVIRKIDGQNGCH